MPQVVQLHHAAERDDGDKGVGGEGGDNVQEGELEVVELLGGQAGVEDKHVEEGAAGDMDVKGGGRVGGDGEKWRQGGCEGR